MSFVAQLKASSGLFNPFQGLRNVTIQLSTTQKVVIVSVSAGVALLAFVAQCLKRRRKAPTNVKITRRIRQLPVTSTAVATSPNGEHTSQTGSQRSGSPSVHRPMHRQQSVLSTLSDRLSAAGLNPATVKLTPQQLGTMDCKLYQYSARSSTVLFRRPSLSGRARNMRYAVPPLTPLRSTF